LYLHKIDLINLHSLRFYSKYLTIRHWCKEKGKLYCCWIKVIVALTCSRSVTLLLCSYVQLLQLTHLCKTGTRLMTIEPSDVCTQSNREDCLTNFMSCRHINGANSGISKSQGYKVIKVSILWSYHITSIKSWTCNISLFYLLAYDKNQRHFLVMQFERFHLRALEVHILLRTKLKTSISTQKNWVFWFHINIYLVFWWKDQFPVCECTYMKTKTSKRARLHVPLLLRFSIQMW
jgi:hypothetical protein